MWTATHKANPSNSYNLSKEDKDALESHPSTKGKYTFKEVKEVKPITTLAKTKKKRSDNQSKD